MRRAFCATAAWVLAGGGYLIAAVRQHYDGFPDVIFLPICAAIGSVAVVGFALVVGWVAGLTPLGRVWRRHPVGAASAAVIGLVVITFGSEAGWTDSYTDPDTGRQWEGLHPAAALGGYFLLMFAVANWPVRAGKLYRGS